MIAISAIQFTRRVLPKPAPTRLTSLFGVCGADTRPQKERSLNYFSPFVRVVVHYALHHQGSDDNPSKENCKPEQNRQDKSKGR